MRALALAAVLLSGCTIPLTRDASLTLGFDGQVRHHANAPAPRSYVGLRASVIHRPK